MKSDLLIVRLKQDKSLCEDLLLEMGILGVHTDFAEADIPAALKRQLAGYLTEHAVVMPLITESLVNWLDAADVIVPPPSPDVLFLAFGLKGDGKITAQQRLPGVEFSAARSIATFADETLRAMATESLSSRLQRTISLMDMWRSPLYIFRKKDGLRDRDILIDVTWSAKPTRPEMAPALATFLRDTFDYLGKPSLKILDFGAGKLRHTVPLLERGYHVTAVDYRALFDKPSDQVKQNLAKARTYGKRFGQLVYPSDFVAQNGQRFDLVLLINVLNIMPEPIERLFVIEQCSKKLRKNGHLLWFCQHGDRDQIAAASDVITDGGCTTGRGRKTFYKDYNDKEQIIRLMKVMGFGNEESVDIKAGSNHALLFKKNKPAILDMPRVIEKTRKILERKVYLGGSESEVAVANVLDADSYVGFGAALSAALADLKPGKKSAYLFENIMTPIIEYVFRNHFRGATIQPQFEIHEGRKRIDIKAEWKTNSSLKTIVTGDNALKSSFVPIECKNYSGILGNEEFGQMVDRCDQRHRHFGIITCREAGARARIRRECNTRFNAHNYLIIVLDDSDLRQLLMYSDQSNDDKIVEYISKKITEVRDLAP